MNIITISRTFLRGDWYYAFGRFQTFRTFYSFLNYFLQKLNRLFLSTNVTNPVPTHSNIFPQIDIQHSLRSLKSDSVAFGFNLPNNIVNELHQHASQERCLRSGDNKPFTMAETNGGKLADGIPIVLGIIENPWECPAVKQICQDPLLLFIVEKHLGYFPKKIKPRLFWSFVNTGLSDDYRLTHWQTVKYHFDVDGCNFIYANFYLTHVDEKSGAHVMIKGSHKKKPLKMLFHSANQPDDSIHQYFHKENEITIEGNPGFGFLQDSSCYHKALAPVERNRLLLQIRFT